jgi:hypothetical protein
MRGLDEDNAIEAMGPDLGQVGFAGQHGPPAREAGLPRFGGGDRTGCQSRRTAYAAGEPSSKDVSCMLKLSLDRPPPEYVHSVGKKPASGVDEFGKIPEKAAS